MFHGAGLSLPEVTAGRAKSQRRGPGAPEMTFGTGELSIAISQKLVPLNLTAGFPQKSVASSEKLFFVLCLNPHCCHSFSTEIQIIVCGISDFQTPADGKQFQGNFQGNVQSTIRWTIDGVSNKFILLYLII